MPACSKSPLGPHANHHDVASQIRVIAQHLRHEHTSLPVWLLINRAGKEHTQIITCSLVSHGCALDLQCDPAKFRLGQQIDTSLLTTGHHHARSQLAAKFCRQCHTSFGVDFWSVCSQQQRRQSSHHTARLRRTIVGEGLGFNALNHRHTSLHDAREHLDPKLFPHFTPRITINPHINGKNQQMLRLIFPTLNEWHQINYRNSSLLRYVALALVGFRRSLGVHWSA